MYNISFLLLSHVCYLAMPTIIGAEPTTGVRVCPRSHTQLFIYYYNIFVCNLLCTIYCMQSRFFTLIYNYI